MTEELCYKYLNFVTIEVERYVSDKSVEDDELIAFAIEIENFKKKVNNSSLDNELKKRVDELAYKYTRKQVKRSSALSFVTELTLSFWIVFLLNRKKQNNRIEDLEQLKSQANTLMLYMKMNY